ncbi:reverse transcriptase domain-containing protein [Tanacetum coccineum]
MRTRSSSNLVGNSSSNPTTTNPKRHNRRRSKQPFSLEESPIATMADQRTMAELLRAPTEGYAEAIVVPPILAEHFELEHSLINMMTSDQFFGLEKDNPHDHIHCDGNSSSSDIAKLTHAVNEQTSAVTTAMTAILKQFQATPPPTSVKAVEKICVTCGGAHPYYQCLAADGNTFPEYRDNIQGYVAAAAGNYNQDLSLATPLLTRKEDERVEETLTDLKHGEFTIKVLPPLVQKAKPHSQRNYVVHQRDPRHPHIPYPSRMNQEKQQEKDEVQIHKFWQMFKRLHINISLVDALILIPKYQKMLKSLLSNKEKLIELANTPLNENYSAIYTPVGIARDVFVLVGKFTFPADFVIVDYESDHRVPLILGRPFLRTARALIDVHGEEMILRDGHERLILNMRHDTSNYSNEPHQESINMIDVYNVSHEEYHENLFATNHPSGNPASSFTSHTDLTSSEVINPLSRIPTPISEPVTKSSSSSSPTLTSIEKSDLIWEEFKAYLASDSFPPGNSNPSSPLPPFHNYLRGNTTSSSPRNGFYSRRFVDKNSSNDNLVDTISEMFTDEHALDYSSPPLWDDYDDELFDLETVNDDTYDDPFDFEEEKIKESKLLIDELDLPESSDFLPFPECDSVFYEDFSKVDTLPSTNNEDKVFNPGILIHENLFESTNCETMEKNVKKTTNASLILEDFNPPLYELPFHKEVPGLGALLSFSSKNEEKVFNPGILTSKRVHTSLLPELSHRGPKAFKVIKILESPMEIFPCSYGEDIRILDVPCLHFYPP